MKLSEYQEQCLLVEYLDILKTQGKVIMFTSIPNSTWTPSFAQRIKNKKSGLNPGFPDLIILTKKKAICLEMKVKPNKPTPAQMEWGTALNERGIKTYCVYGYESAKQVIDSEL